MSGIVGQNLGRGSGLVKATAVVADSVSGASIVDDAIDSEHYTDASIDNAHLADDAVDTAEIADNAITLAKMAGLARGKLIYGDSSGDPAALAVGSANEVLTHDGTDFDWAAAAGGGITAASQWRITADSTGTVQPLSANWEEADAPVGFGVLGSSMTESSGIFTFPSTGYWLIEFSVRGWAAGGSGYLIVNLITTTNNSTYTIASDLATEFTSINLRAQLFVPYIFDVTDTANCKVKFDIGHQNSGNQSTGSTDHQYTGATFIRLGDT